MSILRTRHISSTEDIFNRPQTEESPKLIFISCEGLITEELYFAIVREIFDTIQDKIKIASARDDFFSMHPTQRAQSDIDEQNKSAPRQVLERMDNYLAHHKYWDFENNPDDEFWLVLDVDDHTSIYKIEEWHQVLDEAVSKNYQCAISNPFFEVWLLLHHTDVNEQDYMYAVTNTHSYESTDHFRTRLSTVCAAPLKNKKEPSKDHYSQENIILAIDRAKKLHNTEEDWPHDLGSTVYRLLEKVVNLLPK